MPEPIKASDGKDYPTLDTTVTNAYGVPNNRYAAGYHTGVDFAGRIGDPVYAATGGTVIQVKNTGKTGYGKQVLVQDPDGTYELYGHLSQIFVTPGQAVATGSNIAQVGNTGNSTGSHLHFEVRKTTKYGSDIDPLRWLKVASTGQATTAGGTVIPKGLGNSQTGAGKPQIQQASFLSGTNEFLRIISDGQFWIRVLEIAFGILLVMFGIVSLTGTTLIPGAGATGKAVAGLLKK